MRASTLPATSRPVTLSLLSLGNGQRLRWSHAARAETDTKVSVDTIVWERHDDQQVTGGPLTFDDLSFSAVDPVVGFQTR
jgi:hypothetical protein